LKELYEGKGTHRFLSLLKSISAAKLEDGVAMKDYIRGIRQTADQLSEMNSKLEKAAVVGFILNGLPEGYHYLVVNLESQVQTISYSSVQKSGDFRPNQNRLFYFESKTSPDDFFAC